MATVATQSTHANVTNVFLVTLTGGKVFDTWVQNGGHPNAYEVATTLPISSVEENGVALTERSTVGQVHSNAGSWYHDGTTLYVSSTTDTPHDKSIVAVVTYYFGTREKILNSQYWEPRIVGIPSYSLRIEKEFGGVGQVSSGTLGIANADAFFDSLGVQWNHGSCVVHYGIDRPNDAMAWADYQKIGTWEITTWKIDDGQLSLSLSERTTHLDREIPSARVTIADYPTAPQESIGEAIPLAYGRIYGAKPVVLDEGAKQFKVASHAIRSFNEIRVLIDDVWTTVQPVTSDISTATFSLGADWEKGRDVSVDLDGKRLANGQLMENPADIVEDILAQIGETNLNSSAFAAAAEYYRIGVDGDGFDRNRPGISLFVGEPTEAQKLIEEINQAAQSYLYADGNGQWTYSAFSPQPGDGLSSFNDDEMLSFSRTTKAEKITSLTNVRYAIRIQDEWAQLVQNEDTRNQYNANAGTSVVEDFDSLFWAEDDAEQWSYAYLEQVRGGRVNINISIPWRGFLLSPGDQIRVQYDRNGFDEVLEVLEVRPNLATSNATLTLGNLRGYAQRSGFWVAGTATLPARFSGLTGYGTGGLEWNDFWSETIKTWAKQNVGYWTDSNGFAGTGADSKHSIYIW